MYNAPRKKKTKQESIFLSYSAPSRPLPQHPDDQRLTRALSFPLNQCRTHEVTRLKASESATKSTGDKNKGAIQGNESPEAVEEALEIDLVLGGTVSSVNVLKLDNPTRQIDADPFVLKIVQRQLLLARFQNIPKIFYPHLSLGNSQTPEPVEVEQKDGVLNFEVWMIKTVFRFRAPACIHSNAPLDFRNFAIWPLCFFCLLEYSYLWTILRIVSG